MCAALHGYAAALPNVPAMKISSKRPAASLVILHYGSRAWCSVVAALEPHSSELRLFDGGGVQELVLRPADQEALHLGTLGSERNTTFSLMGTVVGAAALRYRRGYGGDAFHLVMVVGGRSGSTRLRCAGASRPPPNASDTGGAAGPAGDPDPAGLQ